MTGMLRSSITEKPRPLLWDSPQKLEEIDRGLKEAEKHLKEKAFRGMKRKS